MGILFIPIALALKLVNLLLWLATTALKLAQVRTATEGWTGSRK